MKRNYVFSIVIAVFVLLNLLGIIWVINRVMQNTSNIKNQIFERGPLPPEFQYSVLNEKGLMKKWVVNDVFADFVLFQSDLAVGDKKLFLLGSLHGIAALKRGQEHHLSTSNWVVKEGRPRRTGGLQQGGGTRKLNKSVGVQM